MDYLQSLVGKDEETIVDAIKEMAENVEKVQVQAKEIDELNNKLEDNKEEIHYLKRKVDQKYDIIEDVEDELDKMEQKYEDAKKQLELKEKDINALEMLISEQVEEINILRDNNQSMVSQIGENIRMEKKMKVQEAVIKELSEKVKCETNDELIEITSERDKLLLEVKHLEQENEEKLKTLETFEKENQILKDDLKFEQEEKHTFQECLENVDDNLSLHEELSLERVCQTNFSCEFCGKGFGTKNDLQIHFEMSHQKQLRLRRLNEEFVSLETKILQQKFILMSNLSSLQEKDLKRKHVCQCTGVCRINHNIYNWSQPRSETLVIKSKEVLEKQFLVEK